MSVTIHFTATVYELKGYAILPVPEDQSAALPSRGQVSVAGTLNGHEFQTVLEPDGRWSHFIKLSDDTQKQTGVAIGDTVNVSLTTRGVWPEPIVPKDIALALQQAPQKVKEKWRDITPMARWEWVRWVNATSRDETRAIRIEKTISKLNGKHRRPCCFNLAACTDPELARSGRLIQS